MKYVKALAVATALDLYGRVVSWVASSIHAVAADQLEYFQRHADVFTVLGDVGVPAGIVCDSANRAIALLAPDGAQHSLLRTVENLSTAIGYIAPAVTFTTLTQETNAGNCRLISGGIHELTTDPAVGKYVYVAWTGTSHTGVDGLYKILAVDTTKKITIDLAYSATLGTAAVTVADTEVTLHSTTIAAGVMGATGRLNYELIATHTASGDTKTISIKLGATAFTTVAPTTDGMTHISKPIINRSAAVQIAPALAAPGPLAGSAVVTGTIDTTAAQTLSITVKPAVANEVIQIEQLTVTVLPA